MPLLTGLKTDLVDTTKTGLGSELTTAVAYAIDNITPADIATITGQSTPTLMWRGGDASGATELVSGTDNLADSGTPLKEVSSATLGGVITEFDNNTDCMVAASNSVADIGTETVTIMYICKPNSYVTLHSLLGKRDPSSPNAGYEVYSDSSGFMTFVWDTGGAAGSLTVSTAHGTSNAQVVLVTRQNVANRAGIWTREGSATGTRTLASMTNTQIFGLGARRLSGMLQECGACMVWTGTDGDFGDAADFEAARSAVAVALGYE